MGCWGITAFESDEGLDALGCIRKHLPKDGKVKLEDIIDSLKKDLWNHPQDIKEGYTHTSPMMLAEVMVKFLDGETAELDFYGLCESKSVCFSGISSFTADKQSIQYLQKYLSEHLKYKRQMDDFGEKYGEKWGGFVKELDWIEWQGHMEFLIHRMNLLLAATETSGELLDMQYSGEENLQKQLAAVCEKEGHLWQEGNADPENGTGDLECGRCCETITLKW